MYIEPTQEQAIAFFGRPPEGPVVMLNLLRFHDVADYSAHPELSPQTPIRGSEAYDLYSAHTLPHLEAAGGRLLFAGAARPFVIGPADEHWHPALLVEHRSAAAFRAFAENDAYLAGLGHRTAALADSRLLPLSRLGPATAGS